MFRQLASITTCLATVTIIVLFSDTTGIVNNGNILTDGRSKRKNLENKYSELKYLQIYLCWQQGFATTNIGIYNKFYFFFIICAINLTKMNYKVIKISHFIQLQFSVVVYFNQNRISEKYSFLFLLLVRFIRLANIFHTISKNPIDIICKQLFLVR